MGRQKPELEILDLSGKVVRVAWEQVKWVCYVRDLPAGSADQANPERLLRKRFSLRPRTAGLWLRLTLTDGDELEGLAANDRTLVEGAGLLLTPPDTRSNTQRIYVPRQAIQALEVRQPDWGREPEAGRSSEASRRAARSVWRRGGAELTRRGVHPIPCQVPHLPASTLAPAPTHCSRFTYPLSHFFTFSSQSLRIIFAKSLCLS